jgi:choice-of-anchor B domain-containing protein
MMKQMVRDIDQAMAERRAASFDDETQEVGLFGAEVPCVNGVAAGYPCKNVNLLSYFPHSQTQGRNGQGNDIWGWEDPLDGKEYAIVCQTAGTSFFDISDPVNPIFKGRMPTKTTSSTWRDAKVFKNHAYVVAEANAHGIQIFDLTLLRKPGSGQQFTETAYYAETGRCHNIVINEETGLAVCVGSRNVCRGGLYMLDINEPKNPKYVGCYDADGYTHDAQCVVYRGPDAKYQGREICFAYNEDTVTIVDVTDRARPVVISRNSYKTSAYTHQGWLTEDQSYIMFDDELDERQNTTPNQGRTTTYIMDVSSLEQPIVKPAHVSPVTSIDHNLYIKGDRAYMANYASGLRIVDISNMKQNQTEEIAFFDIRPEDNNVAFFGAWSSYIYFRSGVIAVNSIERGLFLVRPTI